jgi:hypothetical protein
VLIHSAVNVPYLDEWEALAPGGLGRELDLGWLLRGHNEHRIVVTKLQTWLMLRLGGWNLVDQQAFNFWVYAGLVVLLLRWLGRQGRAPMGLFLILAASTLPRENHFWGFQSCIHFSLLFYLLALRQIQRPGRDSWLAVLFAALSAYSFAAGVIWAASVAGLAIGLARLRGQGQRRAYLQAAAVLAVVALWMAGYHKNPAHPPFAAPQSRSFWEFLLNLAALGLGFTNQAWLPGLLLLGLGGGFAAAQLASWRRFSDDDRAAALSLLTLAAGIGASLVATTIARAGFGVSQAKTSRYAEIAQILPAILWVWVWQAARARGWAWLRVAALAGGAWLLGCVYHDQYRFTAVYAGMRGSRLALKACIRDYYDGRGDGFCPMGYPAPLASRLDRARALGLRFEGAAARGD